MAEKDVSKTDGFTIIEVLIVLAIGGVMLMIVFMALPSLERNGRNNQRRQDVNTILEAVSHYELNDSGNFPAPCGQNAAHACTLGVASNDNFLRYDVSKLTYFTNATQVVLATPGPSASETNSADVTNPANDAVYVYNYQKCNANGLGQPTSVGAGYNDVVALFAIETGSGSAPQCREL